MVVTLAVAGFASACSEAEDSGYDREFAVATVRTGPLIDTVLATGTVETVRSVEVSSQLSGRMDEVLVDFNDMVRAGQPLARLDPQRYRSRVEELSAALALAKAELASATAGLAGAKADYEEAERDWLRKSELVKKGSVSQSQADRAQSTKQQKEAALAALEAQRDTKEAAIDAARASLRQAEIDLERTTIRAPIDGIVIKRSIEPGQTVAASLDAPELFVIADELDRIKIHASVDEADIGKIKTGQPVRFTVDSFPAQRFSGQVLQIRKAPEMTQNVVTYTVVIRADNPGQILMPGMTAIVEVVAAQLNGALIVPNAALRFDLRPAAAQQGPGVWLLDRGTPRRVPVEIGYSDGEFSQITEGEVAEGDTVIIGYLR